MQSAGADAIGASLVFLDLLESQPDRLAELLLAQAEHVPAEPDSRADMDVDRVWFVALSATRPSGLWLHRHRSIAFGGIGAGVIRHPIDRGQQGVLTRG